MLQKKPSLQKTKKRVRVVHMKKAYGHCQSVTNSILPPIPFVYPIFPYGLSPKDYPSTKNGHERRPPFYSHDSHLQQLVLPILSLISFTQPKFKKTPDPIGGNKRNGGSNHYK